MSGFTDKLVADIMAEAEYTRKIAAEVEAIWEREFMNRNITEFFENSFAEFVLEMKDHADELEAEAKQAEGYERDYALNMSVDMKRGK